MVIKTTPHFPPIQRGTWIFPNSPIYIGRKETTPSTPRRGLFISMPLAISARRRSGWAGIHPCRLWSYHGSAIYNNNRRLPCSIFHAATHRHVGLMAPPSGPHRLGRSGGRRHRATTTGATGEEADEDCETSDDRQHQNSAHEHCSPFADHDGHLLLGQRVDNVDDFDPKQKKV